EGLEVRASLDQRREETGHAANLDPSLRAEQPDGWCRSARVSTTQAGRSHLLQTGKLSRVIGRWGSHLMELRRRFWAAAIVANGVRGAQPERRLCRQGIW